MVILQISKTSQNQLLMEIENKVEGIKELNSSLSKKEISDAVFSLSAIDFIKNTNLKARSMHSSLHHVYEWNQVGKENGRLFRIIKTNQLPGSMIVSYKFNNSKKVVPIPQELKTIGPTGKSIKKSKVFKKKAEVMESGKPVSFITKKTIIFSDRGALKFVPKNKLIEISNPGGKDSSGGFSRHFLAWWATRPSQVAERSGLFSSIENALAKTLSVNYTGKASARSIIQKTTSRFTTVRNII